MVLYLDCIQLKVTKDIDFENEQKLYWPIHATCALFYCNLKATLLMVLFTPLPKIK